MQSFVPNPWRPGFANKSFVDRSMLGEIDFSRWPRLSPVLTVPFAIPHGGGVVGCDTVHQNTITEPKAGIASYLSSSAIVMDLRLPVGGLIYDAIWAAMTAHGAVRIQVTNLEGKTVMMTLHSDDLGVSRRTRETIHLVLTAAAGGAALGKVFDLLGETSGWTTILGLAAGVGGGIWAVTRN